MVAVQRGAPVAGDVLEHREDAGIGQPLGHRAGDPTTASVSRHSSGCAGTDACRAARYRRRARNCRRCRARRCSRAIRTLRRYIARAACAGPARATWSSGGSHSRQCGARRRCTRPPSWSMKIGRRPAHGIAQIARQAPDLGGAFDIAREQDEAPRRQIGEERGLVAGQRRAGQPKIAGVRTATLPHGDGDAGRALRVQRGAESGAHRPGRRSHARAGGRIRARPRSPVAPPGPCRGRNRGKARQTLPFLARDAGLVEGAKLHQPRPGPSASGSSSVTSGVVAGTSGRGHRRPRAATCTISSGRPTGRSERLTPGMLAGITSITGRAGAGLAASAVSDVPARLQRGARQAVPAAAPLPAAGRSAPASPRPPPLAIPARAGIGRQAGRGQVDLFKVERRGRQHDAVGGGRGFLALGDPVHGQPLVVGHGAARVPAAPASALPAPG